ncbi:hypothetical protein ACFFGH_32640 [Lysobacter korlensis]|uniref:Uncharacterized protein n=1 Tax=Lysobacter korlensis TaxID=553636 RepID=A0ABV6S1L1_9GAMM
MMLKRTLISSCLAAALTIGLGSAAADAAAATPAASAASSTRYPELVARADALRAQLPQKSQAAAALDRIVGATQWSELADNALNPGDYACSGTALGQYLDAEIDKIDFGSLYILSVLGGLDLPSYDALVYGNSAATNTYGANGEFTLKLTHDFRDQKKFWDVNSSSFDMLPMHGADVFSSIERTERAAEILYGPGPTARAVAELLYTVVHSDPALQKGAHPLFTFNAFAFPGYAPLGIPERIVMGDGIMQGMQAVGLGENGPRAILAHEFGHQVQFKKNLFDSPLTGAEATRRTELMADAFATYYLTHSRGLSLNAKRLLPSQKSFYEVGDCGFASDGHHGTPTQRLRSASWGASVADSAQKQGHIQPSLSLAARFDAALPELTRPDAP